MTLLASARTGYREVEDGGREAYTHYLESLVWDGMGRLREREMHAAVFLSLSAPHAAH